jgi:hypothetical protein
VDSVKFWLYILKFEIIRLGSFNTMVYKVVSLTVMEWWTIDRLSLLFHEDADSIISKICQLNYLCIYYGSSCFLYYLLCFYLLFFLMNNFYLLKGLDFWMMINMMGIRITIILPEK